MQCIHRVKINRRIEKPVRIFLAQSPVLRMNAAESDMSPAEYVASCFIENVKHGEDFPAWLSRQVTETIEACLLHDDVREQAGGVSVLQQSITDVELTLRDREEINRLFGMMPDLLLMWDRLKERESKAA